MKETLIFENTVKVRLPLPLKSHKIERPKKGRGAYRRKKKYGKDME